MAPWDHQLELLRTILGIGVQTSQVFLVGANGTARLVGGKGGGAGARTPQADHGGAHAAHHETLGGRADGLERSAGSPSMATSADVCS